MFKSHEMNVRAKTQASPSSCTPHTPYAAPWPAPSSYYPVSRSLSPTKFWSGSSSTRTYHDPLRLLPTLISACVVRLGAVTYPTLRTTMDSLSRRPPPYRPKPNSGESTAGRRNRRNSLGPEQFNIVPVPREELPDGMRSVLESVCADCYPLIDILTIFVTQFISSQRPSLADLRLPPPDVQHPSTSARNQTKGSPAKGHEDFDYDGHNDDGIRGPNSHWPFNFTLKGNKLPSRTYHTHKVVPRSRPNAKDQFGRRKWHPSRRYGRLIRHEDYDAYTARSESLLDLPARGERLAKGMTEKAVGDDGLSGWPCSWKTKLGKITKMLCRG